MNRRIEEARQITPGLARAISRGPTKDPCRECGFPMPVYPGRYPKSCPGCGTPRDGTVPTNEHFVDGARALT